MKIVIAGGSGFLGSVLTSKFKLLNYDVFVITRQKPGMWLPENLKQILNGADVLINLSGRNINCVHTKKNKQQILDSRIQSTRLLSNAILDCSEPPRLWINASATAIYEANNASFSIETSNEYSNDFLAQVVHVWEDEFFKFDFKSIRRVALRTSVVFSQSSGAYPVLRKLTKLGLGGRIGDGKQQFSWIHVDDYFRVVDFIISNVNISGVVNCTSPAPVSNKQLMKSFRTAFAVKFGLPAPKFLVQIGAPVLGTDASLITKSTNVYPQTLLDNGFVFNFNNVVEVLTDFE